MSRDLAVLSASFFLIFMGAGAFQQYLIRFMKDVTGRSATECSWVLATIYLSFLVWRVLAAYTIRWLGDQRSIFLGQVTYTLFLVFAIFTREYWLLLAAAALWGWGASAMWIASSTQVLDASARTRYGSASGVFYAATHLGQWLGVILLGWLLTQGAGVHSWEWLWGERARERGGPGGAPQTVPREEPRISKVFGVLRSPESKALAILLFVSSAGFGLILSLFGTLLSGQTLVWVTSGFYGGRLVSSCAEASPTVWAGAGCSSPVSRWRRPAWSAPSRRAVRPRFRCRPHAWGAIGHGAGRRDGHGGRFYRAQPPPHGLRRDLRLARSGRGAHHPGAQQLVSRVGQESALPPSQCSLLCARLSLGLRERKGSAG